MRFFNANIYRFNNYIRQYCSRRICGDIWYMNYNFFDFETTDLSPFGAEIITACFIRTDEQGEVLSQNNYRLKPYFPESFGGTEIHGITKEQAMEFPDRKEVLAKMMQEFSGEVMPVCFANPNNKSGVYLYDFAIIKAELARWYYETYLKFCRLFPANKQINVHQMFKDAYQKGKINKIKRNKKNQPSYSLDSLAYAFDIPLEHHNAESDTMALYKGFIKLKKLTPIKKLIEE